MFQNWDFCAERRNNGGAHSRTAPRAEFRSAFRDGSFFAIRTPDGWRSPIELTDKLFQMMLHDPVQIDQFTIQIVDDFDGRGFGPHEEQRGGAAKDFDIAVMRRK